MVALITEKPGVFSLVKRYWFLFVLALIALLSFGLNFFMISREGYCNAYYAAAVRSMTGSFRNFFYVSFDPAGFLSVDKPPLGLWVQALFVFIFGYHGWSMLLPQALAATGSAVMMYVLTAKHFGRPAGLLAALVFAVTPAVVAVARNNTMDAQLVLVLLAAAWFLLKSVETSKRRYLLVCAALVGLGFNIKMLEAYLILPAVVLVYLIFDRHKFFKRLVSGLAGLAVMLAVSSVWVLVVELTPAENRPYVDSTSHNSMMELVIGHNGLDRLLGAGKTNSLLGGSAPKQSGAAAQETEVPAASPALPADSAGSSAHMPDHIPWADIVSLASGTAGTGSGGIGDDIGKGGLLRLWSPSLYGQVTWLVILALFCIPAECSGFRLKNRPLRQAACVFWLGWFVTAAVFFGFANFWHRYYLCIAAPAIAGLVGIGLPELIRSFRDRQGWRQLLLPLALMATAVPEIIYVMTYPALRTWLMSLIIAAAAAALLLMAAYSIKPILPKRKTLLLRASAALLLVALLSGPFYWSLTAVLDAEQNSTLPYAGPERALQSPGYSVPSDQRIPEDPGTAALEKYLVSHYTPGSYLVVAKRAGDVARFIVDTGLPAISYSGFLGTDNAMTLDTFKELVAQGKITYFLLKWNIGVINDTLSAYVWDNASLVDPAEYLETGSPYAAGGALFLFS